MEKIKNLQIKKKLILLRQTSCNCFVWVAKSKEKNQPFS